jgi:serine protease
MATSVLKWGAWRLVVLAGLLVSTQAQAFQRANQLAAASEALDAGLTDRLIVKYRDATSAGAPSAASLLGAGTAGRRQGVTVSHQRRIATGADVLKLSQRLSSSQLQVMAADMKAADSSIEYVEADRVLHPQITPNDTQFSAQWNLADSSAGIRAPVAWDLSTGSGVVVAVVDTGVRPHADLAANLLSGYDFISSTVISNDGDTRDSDPADPGDYVSAGYCSSSSAASDSSWHGTHVAGILAAVANNGVGVAGVAYGAKILPVRVLGRCGGYMSDIADGMVWAAGGSVSGVSSNANPAKVINLSLGASGACSTTLQTAITKARALGASVVVAAGNAAVDASQYTPGNCSGVINVAATSSGGGRSSYSNYGTAVTLAAPGGDTGAGIVSTLNAGTTTPGGDSYASYMGTSMATPHVSGVAALMLAVNSQLTPDQISSLLQSSARAFTASCDGCGAGLLDAYAAVTAAAAATTTSSSTAEVESNNTLSTAQAISSLPTTVSGSMATTSDTDFYKVSVAAGSKLVVTLAPNASSNYDLYVYNAAGRPVAYSAKGVGQADTVTVSNTGSASAIAYVRVIRISGLTGTSGSYTLAMSN